MVSKAGFSAPNRRILYSSSAAKSRSLAPGFKRAAACSKAREFVWTERRMRSISSGDFNIRISSIQPATGCKAARMGKRPLSASNASQVMRASYIADTRHPGFRNRAGHFFYQRTPGDPDSKAVAARSRQAFLTRLNGVPRVSEQERPFGRDKEISVAAGKAGEE